MLRADFVGAPGQIGPFYLQDFTAAEETFFTKIYRRFKLGALWEGSYRSSWYLHVYLTSGFQVSGRKWPSTRNFFGDFCTFLAQNKPIKVKTMQNDRLHQTVVVLETTTMSPLSFWVTNTKDNDLGSIIRLELEKAQNQQQKRIRPSNGKLCLGEGHLWFQNFNSEQFLTNKKPLMGKNFTAVRYCKLKRGM